MTSNFIPINHTDKLLTTKEVAKILGVSVASLEYNRWSGKGIPFLRLGTRTIRYRLSDVNAWLEKQQRINTSNGSPKGDGYGYA